MMWTDLLAVVVLAALTGGWVVVQRVIARSDPDQPGVEGSCHGCRGGCSNGVCRNPEPRPRTRSAGRRRAAISWREIRPE